MIRFIYRKFQYLNKFSIFDKNKTFLIEIGRLVYEVTDIH